MAAPSPDSTIMEEGDCGQWRHAKEQFPTKLYALLEIARAGGFGDSSDAVAWLPHGRAFRIVDERRFVEQIVPKFFSMTQIRSFMRQLYLWGFKRITKGLDDGAWYHECFLRGFPEDIERMVRVKIKGTKSKEPGDAPEPNFYSMSMLSLPATSVKSFPSNHAATPSLTRPTDNGVKCDAKPSAMFATNMLLSGNIASSETKQTANANEVSSVPTGYDLRSVFWPPTEDCNALPPTISTQHFLTNGRNAGNNFSASSQNDTEVFERKFFEVNGRNDTSGAHDDTRARATHSNDLARGVDSSTSFPLCVEIEPLPFRDADLARNLGSPPERRAGQRDDRPEDRVSAKKYS